MNELPVIKINTLPITESQVFCFWNRFVHFVMLIKILLYLFFCPFRFFFFLSSFFCFYLFISLHLSFAIKKSNLMFCFVSTSDRKGASCLCILSVDLVIQAVCHESIYCKVPPLKIICKVLVSYDITVPRRAFGTSFLSFSRFRL